MRLSPIRSRAFTLIELLVVISIVAILMGLAFPVFQGVQNTAKKTQAKNDLVQIVTAVNAFYTEYGRYPLPQRLTTGDEYADGPGANRSKLSSMSFAAWSHLDIKSSTDRLHFTAGREGSRPTRGEESRRQLMASFSILGESHTRSAIDADYDNQVANPYSTQCRSRPQLRVGVIAWSLGKDR